MPELLTKFPEVTLTILKDAQIRCGKGDKQTILTTCPKGQFCTLPTGEFCVYGVKELPQMMQINLIDLMTVPGFFLQFLALLALVFLAGTFLGLTLNHKKTKV